MNHEQLPQHWKDKVAEHARALSGGRFTTLGLTAFPPQAVTLAFADGSSARFCYAFILADEPRRELAIFTEHCGYHIFPLAETTVTISQFDEAADV